MELAGAVMLLINLSLVIMTEMERQISLSIELVLVPGMSNLQAVALLMELAGEVMPRTNPFLVTMMEMERQIPLSIELVLVPGISIPLEAELLMV
jgi:hypothetical protein